MADFQDAMTGQAGFSEADQKAAGKPIAGSIGDEHKNFLTHVFGLLDSGEINVDDPQTFLNHDVYNGLSEEWQGKSDLALINIVQQVKQIDEYRKTHGAEDAIHLHTMVEHLWEMKQRIEEHYDVYKL